MFATATSGETTITLERPAIDMTPVIEDGLLIFVVSDPAVYYRRPESVTPTVEAGRHRRPGRFRKLFSFHRPRHSA